MPVDDVVNYYKKLTSAYPIKSIEDPFAEDDWILGKKLPKQLEKMFKLLEMIYL